MKMKNNLGVLYIHDLIEAGNKIMKENKNQN